MISRTARPDRDPVDRRDGHQVRTTAELTRLPHAEPAAGGWQSPAGVLRQVAVEPSTGQHHNRLQVNCASSYGGEPVISGARTCCWTITSAASTCCWTLTQN